MELCETFCPFPHPAEPAGWAKWEQKLDIWGQLKLGFIVSAVGVPMLIELISNQFRLYVIADSI